MHLGVIHIVKGDLSTETQLVLGVNGVFIIYTESEITNIISLDIAISDRK